MRIPGFTLIEMLLSVALLAMMAGILAPVYHAFRVRNDLDVAAMTIAQNFRRAALAAEARDGASTWGVHIQPGAITLFRGTSYASRVTASDEVSELPADIAPSGLSETVFALMTGFPQSVGTVTLTSNTNETRIITINAKGAISY
jgi:prepilin-type N-terminal cleavage/methylation domain-containing protein